MYHTAMTCECRNLIFVHFLPALTFVIRNVIFTCFLYSFKLIFENFLMVFHTFLQILRDMTFRYVKFLKVSPVLFISQAIYMLFRCF